MPIRRRAAGTLQSLPRHGLGSDTRLPGTPATSSRMVAGAYHASIAAASLPSSVGMRAANQGY